MRPLLYQTLSGYFMNRLTFITWLSIGCSNSTSKAPSLSPNIVHGVLNGYTSSDCEFAVNIDVIQTGIEEPIYLTEVDEDGRFELKIPRGSADAPLHVYGFCYDSTTDLDSDVPIWSTEPFLLLPTYDVNKPITLIKATLPQAGDAVAGPLIINQYSTEYTLWAQNPLLIEYYDLRHPNRDDNTAGSIPEIRQGGASTKTQLTHIFALLSFLRANSEPYLQELLLPRPEDIQKLHPELLPTSPQLQITRGVLENACLALKLPCPSLNNLRQQQWILNDTSSLADPRITQLKAELWFAGHHFIQQLLLTQQTIPRTIPMPSDLITIKTIDDANVIRTRWDELYETYKVTKVSIDGSL